MVWKRSVAIVSPANMIAVNAPLTSFDIRPTSSHIELHANWFVLVFSKFDRTAIRDLDAPFSRIFATLLALALAFGVRRMLIRLRPNSPCRIAWTLSQRQWQHVKLNIRVMLQLLDCCVNILHTCCRYTSDFRTCVLRDLHPKLPISLNNPANGNMSVSCRWLLANTIEEQGCAW